MNTFAKIYVIGSNFVFVSVPMVWPIFGAQLSPILSFLLTLVWIIWNLIALAKFQKASVPLIVPMLCPIMVALAFQTMLLSYVSSDSIARLLIGLGVLLFSVLTLAYFVLSAKLFYVISAQTVDPLLSSEFRSFSDGFAVPSVKQEVVFAGFWRRFLAALIDGTILGFAGSVVLVLTFIVFAAFAHKDLAAFFQSLRTVWSGTINGFAMGFVSPVAAATYWLCCLAGLSKVVGMTGLTQLSMLVSMLSLFIINCVSIT